MAKIFIEETTLSNIGNAIRDKEGTSDLIPVNDMASRISAITTGGGNEPTDEELTLTGDCTYRFAYNAWNWVIKNYGDRITTKGIINCEHMFYNSNELTSIPFEINLTTRAPASYMFQGCTKLTHIPDLAFNHITYADAYAIFSRCNSLEELPKITGLYPNSMPDMFYQCYRLRYIPEDYFDTWNFSRVNSYQYADASGLFTSCYSLRKIPEKLFTLLHPTSSSTSYAVYSDFADNCYALEEITNLPVITATMSSNSFNNTARYCYRLKNFTFETNEDGTPKIANWRNQTIDLSFVGSERLAGTNINYIVTKPAEYAQGHSNICKYNSGISPDKVIVDDVTYQALKNDPESFVCSDNDTTIGASPYSRYNLQSATNTINSLPNTSAYANNNTIKFRTGAGTATDGGGITADTIVELAALAQSKGWIVALV